MPSTDLGRSRDVLDVARRYLRRERPLTAVVVLLAVSLFVGTYLVTSLLPAVLVAAVLLIGMRFPILRPSGTLRLRTDENVDAVIDEFTGPTPPVLALQWGMADEVSTEGGAARYSVSYLFGLRSVDVVVRTEAEPTPDGDLVVTSEVTVDDRPWATYVSTIRGDDRTTVDVTYTADRRFGLRRVPQRLVANRYRDDVLSVQGYTVVDRDARFGA
jgi:hypothetical protein